MSDAREFPTQLADDPDGGAGALGWTTGVIALTAAALALFNAGSIATWAEDLDPGPATIKVVTVADAWQDATARLGLGAAHADLHRAWTRAQSAHWSGYEGGQDR